MSAYVARPKGDGPFPGIIVFQEAFGVNRYIQRMADRFAAEGYVAIAPELFHRTAPAGFEARYYQMPLVMPHIKAITTETLIADATAAYDWLTQQQNVDAARLACIGFCMGGRAALLANSALKFGASVSFYGGYMHSVTDKVSMVCAPQLLFWGGKDQHILPEHVAQVVAAFKAAGKEYVNVEFSNADHGFFCDERDAWHPQAASEAWGITREFLRNRVG